ncbi:hypothetical protein D3C78_1817010 [compost metagenome]
MRQYLTDVGLLYRLLQLIFAGLRVPQQNIGPQRLSRQVRVLTYPAKLLSPAFGRQFAQFGSIDG